MIDQSGHSSVLSTDQRVREHIQRVAYELSLLFVEDPVQLFVMLGRGESARFLRVLWQLVAQVLPPDQRLPFEQLDVWYQPTQTLGQQVTEHLIIQFPRPQAVHEVHFFALYRVDDQTRCFLAVAQHLAPKRVEQLVEITAQARRYHQPLHKAKMEDCLAAIAALCQHSVAPIQIINRRLVAGDSLLAVGRHPLMQDMRVDHVLDDRQKILDLSGLYWGRKILLWAVATWLLLMLLDVIWPWAAVAVAFLLAVLIIGGTVLCAMSLRYWFLLYIFMVLIGFMYPFNLLMMGWFLWRSSMMLVRHGWLNTLWSYQAINMNQQERV